MRRGFLGAALLAVLVLAVWIGFLIAGAPDQAVLARMIPRQHECRKLLEDMRRLGMVRQVVPDGSDAALIYVATPRWNEGDAKSHLTTGLALWCALTPPSGYFTVTLRNESGENVFRIKNGSVASWF